MKQLRNINPLGYVDLPLIGREGPAIDDDGNPTPAGAGCLVPGEVFEVSDEHAAILLEQTTNYELVETPKKKG